MKPVNFLKLDLSQGKLNSGFLSPTYSESEIKFFEFIVSKFLNGPSCDFMIIIVMDFFGHFKINFVSTVQKSVIL